MKPHSFGLITCVVTALAASFPVLAQETGHPGKSIARQWNEQLLSAIRLDEARPTVHARNLFHISVAMWDAWAAFDDQARGMIHIEKMKAANDMVARHEAISYAAFSVGLELIEDAAPRRLARRNLFRRRYLPRKTATAQSDAQAAAPEQSTI